ncbi:MAG: CopD family protein, partial [Gemmatimonadetes bacterium]|nr:CopD family protein [Gemmatimonadota bacterium]
FSRAALFAVPALLVTGAAANWTHGGGLGALLQPGWGRALAIKILLVSGMAALGFYNWRVTLPRLQRGDPDVAFGRGAPAWEALLGLAVLGATAVLVALSPPSGG